MSTSPPQHSGASAGGKTLTPSEGSAFGDGISGNGSRMNISFWKDPLETKITKGWRPGLSRYLSPELIRWQTVFLRNEEARSQMPDLQ